MLLQTLIPSRVITYLKFQVEKSKNQTQNVGYRGVQSWLENIWSGSEFQEFCHRQFETLQSTFRQKKAFD